MVSLTPDPLLILTPLPGTLLANVDLSTMQAVSNGFGVYLVNVTSSAVTNITTPAGTGIRLDGGGGNQITSSEVSWPGATQQGYGIRLVSSSNNTATNSTSTNHFHGFSIEGDSDGNSFTNVSMADVTQYGVYDSSDGGNTFSGVYVSWDVTFPWGRGMYFLNSSGNTVQGSTVSNFSAAATNGIGIYLHGDSDSNTFLGNTVSTSTYAVYMRGDTGSNDFQSNDLSGNVNAIYAWDSLIGQGNIFQNNNLSNSTGWSLLINGDQLFTVSGNDFTNSTNGIGLANMGGVSLSDANVDLSTMQAVSNGFGVYLVNVTSSAVTNITTPAGTGIRLDGGGGNQITSSEVSWPGATQQGYGIRLVSSSNNTITNSTSTNHFHGFSIEGDSDGNTFQGGDLAGSTQAVSITGTSDGNSFTNVSMADVTQYGVYDSSDGGNTFSGVYVSWDVTFPWGRGMYFLNSSGNTVQGSTVSNFSAAATNGIGIYLHGDSDSNTFLGNTVSTSTYAVYMRGDTGSNDFQSNNLSGNVNAIYAWDSLIGQGNIFQNNNLSNSTGWSLLINGDQLFTVSGNDFTNSANGIGLANMGGVSLSDANVDLSTMQAVSNGFGVYLVNVTSSAVTNITTPAGTGIRLDGGGGNQITSSEVSWPGATQQGYGIRLVSSSNNSVEETTASGHFYGVHIGGNSTGNSFQCGSLTGNTYGVLQPGAGSNAVNFSLIVGNASYGVRNDGGDIFNAANNYWGESDGPGGAGSGSGDLVSVNVTFEPFATDPVQLENFCNIPPTAVAGPDQTVDEGSTATLDASDSTDLDGDPITFAWELVSFTGPAVVLSSTTAPSPTFDATDDGVYTFEVTVEDGKGGVDTDDIVVTVTNVAPTVDAGPDVVVVIEQVHDVSASFTDPGILDTHTAIIDWGDGTTSTGIVIEADATVDPATVLFGPTGTEAAPVHSALEDVDDDGDVDMILHFDSRASKIACGDIAGTLTGETFAGQAVRGSDTVRTVGCK